jgi:hypothetical protein
VLAVPLWFPPFGSKPVVSVAVVLAPGCPARGHRSRIWVPNCREPLPYSIQVKAVHSDPERAGQGEWFRNV